MLPKYLHRFENALYSFSDSFEQQPITVLKDYDSDISVYLTVYSLRDTDKFIIDMHYTRCNTILIVISSPKYTDSILYTLSTYTNPVKSFRKLIDIFGSYYQLSHENSYALHTNINI